VRTAVVDGKVYAHLHCDRFVPLAETPWGPSFYVCPRTGCLRDCQPLRKKARRTKRRRT